MSKLENVYWGRNTAHFLDFVSYQPLVLSFKMSGVIIFFKNGEIR